MSYDSQHLLTYDEAFVSRSRACIVQQSQTFKTSGTGDVKALANSLLVGLNSAAWQTFHTVLGAAPGLADKVDQGDGTVDSSLITDAEILSNVQAEYPGVAALYFHPDGTPIPQPAIVAQGWPTIPQ